MEEFKKIEQSEHTKFIDININEVKKYWNKRPCNIKHSNKTIGTKEYYDEIEKKKYFVESHIPEFAEFNKYNGKKILEIGCGLGTETINFARSGADITVIDLSEESINLLKKRLEVFNLKANIYCGNAEELDTILPKEELGSFDLIWSFGVIHHSPNPEKIVEQIYKFLKKDGELKLMVYSKISYKLFWLMKITNTYNMNLIDPLIAQYSEAQTGCPVTYTYTINQIYKLLNKFAIEFVRKKHIFTWKIDKYIKNEYEKEDEWKDVPDDLFQELENELGWHLIIKAHKL
jgi:2-polyprenyl-3-methyl-5-hydroxy-6-metoxy-1,4-benzoquinol methylase